MKNPEDQAILCVERFSIFDMDGSELIGVIDLRVMTAVTAAITVERLVPAGWQALRVVGFVAMGAGLILIICATGSR